jgi:integrase
MAKKKQDQDQGKETRRGHGEGSWQYIDELDKWKFRVSAKDPDGVTRRFSVTAVTKTECRELAKARAEQIEKGIGLSIDTKNITVTEYLARWLKDYVNPSKSASTKRIYKSLAEHQLAGKIGEIQLRKLQRPTIQRYFNELAAAGTYAGTLVMARVVLHAALKQACDDRIIGSNPATGIKLPPVNRKERIAYSAADVQKILQQVAEHKFRIGFHLLFSLALREGEMVGLRWKNVDLENNRVQIVEQLSREKKSFTFTPPKTKGSIRTLPLSPELVAELKSHCIKQKEMLLKAGIILKDDMTVLSDAIGQPIRHEPFLKAYSEVVKAVGLESTGCHDARHTRITLLANSGMDPKTLSRFAGHSEVAFTMQVYVTPSEELAAAAVSQADKIIYQAK